MKQTNFDKALRLMCQDYVAISEHSNAFVMMTRVQEAAWENKRVAYYLKLGGKFLDFELERRSKLTDEDRKAEEFNFVMFGCRVEPKTLVTQFKEWANTQYNKSKLANL